MLSENDLRDALQDAGQPRRSLSADGIVRRGHRRRVIVQSATGASVLGVVGIIAVTGLSLSDGSAPASVGVQPGTKPAASPSPSFTGKATGAAIPIVTGTDAPVPSLPATVSAAPPQPESTVVATGTQHATTSIPLAGGTVAYSLRPEPFLHNANGILLDVAGADGSLTIKVDGGIPAAATTAKWWSGPAGDGATEQVVYGAVPAGATHVQLFVDGKPLEVSTTQVPGATALAFTLIDRDTAQTLAGPVSKLTYVDAAGTTVTALASTSGSVG